MDYVDVSLLSPEAWKPCWVKAAYYQDDEGFFWVRGQRFPYSEGAFKSAYATTPEAA